MTTTKRRSKWAMRTVRDGKVRIGGVDYRPNETHRPYDGRLDGMRFLFGRYFTGSKIEPFVSLWGTEQAARDPEANLADEPQCVDGHLPWDFWDAPAAGEAK
jgi:hypothetical protein